MPGRFEAGMRIEVGREAGRRSESGEQQQQQQWLQEQADRTEG